MGKLGTPIKTFKEEDVPIRPLEFSGVSPLLIPGLATTEQYFDLNNSVDEKRSDRRGKKKKHKEKSKKRSKHIDENGIVPNDRENSNELPVFVNRAAEIQMVQMKRMAMKRRIEKLETRMIHT